MARQFVIFAAVLASCNAGPVWIDSAFPGVLFREGRSPSVAFGFGSGFSSNIGGITHSTGISSSFGDAQGYGAGIAGNNGNVFARGIGYANAAPSYTYHPVIAYPYHAARSWAYGPGSSATAQNFGNYGSAVSTAHSQGYGSAVSSAQSQGLRRVQAVTSSAHSLGGYGSAVSSASNGLEAAVSSAQNAGSHKYAVSSVHGHNGYGNYGTAVSAAQNIGGVRASTAQTSQQRGYGFQSSGASSIDGPGIQAAQSHAVNTY